MSEAPPPIPRQTRRLRGPQPHVPVRHDSDGQPLMSRRLAAEMSGRNPSVIHRAAKPVACDVETRVLLVAYDDLLKGIPNPRTAADDD